MPDHVDIDKRCEPRIDTISHDDLNVIVRRQGELSGEELNATVVDVSSAGLKLTVGQPLVFNETIELYICCSGPDVDLSVSSEVRWIRQGDKDGIWIVGCLFTLQLPVEVLQKLVVNGTVDRRRSPRFESTAKAAIQWEASEEVIPVSIVNLSSQGVCICSKDPAQGGRRLRLAISQPDGQHVELTAVARWQVELDSGYLVGCETTNLPDASPLDMMDNAASVAPEEPRQARAHWTLLGIGLVVLVAGVSMLLL